MGSEGEGARRLLGGGKELALCPGSPIAAWRREPDAPRVMFLLHSQPQAPSVGVFHCHKPRLCLGEPLLQSRWVRWTPKTKQRAPLKPKACCASPFSCAALLLLPSSAATPWLGGLPEKDAADRAVRMKFSFYKLHPKSLCACFSLPPSSASPCGLYPGSAGPLCPRRQVSAGCRGGSQPSRRGASPVWQLTGWWGAASQARSLPRGSCRNKCPLRAGGWKTLVPATGAAQAKTPQL